MRRGILSLLVWASLGALGSGCYASHERATTPGDAGARRDTPGIDEPPRDGGPRFDAGARVDAGPFGDAVWFPVDATDAEILVERCVLREGQSPIFRLRVVANLCDEPGNTRWSVDAATRTVTLDPFVWRPRGGPACPPGTYEIVRDVTLWGASLAAGDWTVALPDGRAAVPFRVDPGPPELTCTDCRAAGETCAVDVECSGERTCVPMRGDGACASFCEAPCQPFPDAPGASDLGCTARLGGASTCDVDPTLGGLCREGTRDLCPPCPPGTSCRADSDALSYCSWSLSPWDAGGACEGDRDCPAGASCVRLGGTQSCQVRCRSDHPCPFDRCGPAAVVCEIPKI